jgi:DNA polymerase-3 subunit delta
VAKVAANRARAYLQSPDSAHRALLLYGPDATQITARRDDLVRGLLGGADDDPCRRARRDGDQVRRDGALLADELGALAFGGGDRVVVVNGATDGAAKTVAEVLDTIDTGVTLVLTAGPLAASSKLRKLFEGAGNAVALPFYPPEGSALEAEFGAMLGAQGAPPVGPEARGALAGVLAGFQFGEAERFAEVLALYVEGEDEVTAEAVFACAPPAAEADFDTAIQAVAGGQPRAIPSLVDGLLRVLSMHFQRLHRAQAVMEREGVDAGAAMSKLRPPVFWKLRDSFAGQIRAWPHGGVEDALTQIGALEADLRSGRTLPERAMIERVLMRIAMTAPGARRR